MKSGRVILFSTVVVFVLLPAFVLAEKVVSTFEVPNPKSEFCGPVMQAAMCQCAFHGNCGSMNFSQASAYTFVESEFREWVGELIKKHAEQCIAERGHWNTNTRQCITCTNGEVLSGTKCVSPDGDIKPNTTAGQCQALTEFAGGWKKFSDFDDAIPVNEASFEVQEYNRVLDELAKKITEAGALEYDMEVDRQVRVELRAYKQALVDNLRDNITKAIFRLAWVTYNAYQGAQGAAGSYQTLLDPENVVEGVGAGLKTIQGAIPSDAKELTFDTSTIEGKVKSGAWNAALETLESVDDPKTVAMQALKDIKGAAVPGPDITAEEVEILRTQHLENLQVDKALADSYARNSERRLRLLSLEKEIAELYNEMEDWRSKEYSRVKAGIEATCQK